jgi:hypothetical protein
MALTVSTDLTNITDAETYTGWTDVSGGAGGAVEPDFFVQNANCVSRAISGVSGSRGMIFDNGADLDFTTTHADKLIYFWIQDTTPALTDNVATAPGLTIRIDTSVTPGTNYFEWDIVYSDLLAPAGTDAFRMYVLDPRAPATRTNGSPSLTTLRHFGAVLDTNATAKGRNLSIDRISYGFGEIIVTGTATDATSGFQEMIDWDWGTIANRWGIISERGGIAFVKGKLVIGDDAGTLATSFTGQDTIMVWESTWYYDGTRVRPTIGYDSSGNWASGRKSDGTAYFGIDLRGNGTGATDVTFGAIVGTEVGRSGPTLIGSVQIPTEFTGDDSAVENTLIYGTTFENWRKLDFASNASTDDFFSCTLKKCGTLDIGPVVARNNFFIGGLGGGYEFLEYFFNEEASAAEQLSTADPITEWTDLLNGTDWSVPSATAGYVELLGGTTRTNITHLDDDKVGSDDHYADCIVRFPVAGAGQGTLGPCIAVDSAAEDYFWVEVDLASDTIELFRVNTGTDTSIAGPTTFTMDEDEDYLILLRRNGTTIEAFASGNSVADGFHTTKLSATDSAHTGTSHRLVGLRGDALAGQTGATGERPRVRLFGAGPITDNLGGVLLDTAANDDFADASFINCARGLAVDNTGTYTHDSITLSDNLAASHNDSGGLWTGSFTGTGSGVPENTELLGASSVSFSADVTLTVTVKDAAGDPIQTAQTAIFDIDQNPEVQLMNEDTNASGVATEGYNFGGVVNISVRVRKGSTGATKYVPVNSPQQITASGLDVTITLEEDVNNAT